MEILDAAESSTQAGHDVSDMTILISPSGGIQMVAENDWPLEALQAHRGAGMAYRISRQGDKVRLEGRAGSRTCLFETAKPDGAARRPLADRPQDILRPIVFNPNLPGAAAPPLLQAVPG